MGKMIGDIIHRTRTALDETQDEYGRRYSVSGPAVFKFEKGYVRPSLKLWLLIAADAEVSERRAVLLWLKSKLPQRYEHYVELQSAAAAERSQSKRRTPKAVFSKCADREALLAATAKDDRFAAGLLELLEDDELWALYKPSGAEVDTLVHIFTPLGRGSKSAYREALCVLREFK